MRPYLLMIRTVLAFACLSLIAGDASPSAQRTLSAEELAGLLEDSLKTLWKVQDGTLSVEFERPPAALLIPQGPHGLQPLLCLCIAPEGGRGGA